MKHTIHKSGVFRGDKIRYPDGVGCTIWVPYEYEGVEEDCGLCFDFAYKDIDDLIIVLNKIKKARANVYKDD